MSKGKQKGFKKKQIGIRDESMAPYYLIKEDKQYVKMLEGNSLPQGYYVKLANALSSISKDVLLEQEGQTHPTPVSYTHLTLPTILRV